MSDLRTNDDFFEFAKSLTHIRVDDLREFFGRFDIKIPLHVHRFVLRETIYPEVFEEMRYAAYSDELKYRLRKFRDFPIFLYENLIDEQDLDFDSFRYKELLFDVLFVNRDMYELTSLFFDKLKQLRDKTETEGVNLTYDTLYEALRPVFYQVPGFLDGIPQSEMKETLVDACTLGELRGLGEKYDVKIPRRINKKELVAMLAAKLRLTEEERELLEKKSVLDIEMYAKEKGFKISTDLKKADMVEYLSFRLELYDKESREDTHNYDVPLLRTRQVPWDEGPSSETEVSESSMTSEKESAEADENEDVIVTPQPADDTGEDEIPIESMAEETEAEIEDEESPEEKITEQEPSADDIADHEEKIEEKPGDKAEKDTLEQAASVSEEAPSKPVHKEKPPQEEEETEMTDSDEMRAALDEKIDEIIREYNHKKRRKHILVSILIVVIVLIVVAVGYGLLYYNYIDYGNLPFGIPVFWE